ncbi:hypothetical protein [Dankookia rubra]|uniref:hypothetical protein n=1 Tax=Dankookia rubra TaxID=1442381 RepID=UPI00140A0636|nr:hypothetical protein [Dankookia rubra]
MPETAQRTRRETPFEGLTGAFWCRFPPDLRYGKGAGVAHLLGCRFSGSDFIKVMNE